MRLVSGAGAVVIALTPGAMQVLSVLAVTVVASVSTPADASATCNEHCLQSPCTIDVYKAAGSVGTDRDYWEDRGECSEQFCDPCSELVKDVSFTAETILNAVRMGSPADMKAIAQQYGDYLLINADRALLVIKGLQCDPDALGAVMPLSREKVNELRAAGVEDLARYLANREHGTQQ